MRHISQLNMLLESFLLANSLRSRTEALWRSLVYDNFSSFRPTKPAPPAAGFILSPLLSLVLICREDELRRDKIPDHEAILSSKVRAIQRAVIWLLRLEPESTAFLPEVNVLERLAKRCDSVNGWHLQELDDIKRWADTAQLTKDLCMLVPCRWRIG